MNHPSLTKILYSSLALSCIDPQHLFAMDAPMEFDYSTKRTRSAAGFDESDQNPKRPCLKTLEELPIRELIEKSYVNENCRNLVIQKIYHGDIIPISLDINLNKLLCLDTIQLSIETLTSFELHLICIYNPDNVLNTDVGKTLIMDLQNKAQFAPCAQNTLAALYENGIPYILKQNLNRALDLYAMAADQGNATAQYNLVCLYKNGRGVPQNYSMSLKCFTHAADQGLANAQCNLGFMYQYGQGVPQNYEMAFKCFTHAADQGDATAQNSLGSQYKNGHGVPQNYALAFKWFTKAAKQGNPIAQINLGSLYQDHQDIPQDYPMALK